MPSTRPVRRSARVTAAVVALTLFACVTHGKDVFQAESLGEGVTLFRPIDERSARTNSLVVERANDLVVIEAQPTPEAARELLAAIGKQSSKPVQLLIVSHPHAESAGGATAFAGSTLLVATEDYRLMMEDEDHDFGAEMRELAPDPDRWTAPPTRPLDLSLFGRMDLPDPVNPLHVIVLATVRHTTGELMVYLPSHDTLYLGPLLTHDRNPYASGGNIGNWISLFNTVIRMAPGKIVGLRGPTKTVADVRSQRDDFIWVSAQVETRFMDSVPMDQIRDDVLNDPVLRERFNLDASPSFVPQLVDQLIEESLTYRRKRGMM